MKVAVAFFVCAMATQSIAQTPDNMKKAIASKDTTVRAVHSYPGGSCHTTHVISVVVNGSKITIKEKWSIQTLFGKAEHTTTLVGTLTSSTVTGTWSSSAGSSGLWTYDFQKNTGEWNKPYGGPFTVTFNEMQPLALQIVSVDDVLDRLGQCPE